MKSFQLILHFSILNFILWLREVDLLMNVLQLVHMQAHVYKSNYPNHISHQFFRTSAYVYSQFLTIQQLNQMNDDETWYWLDTMIFVCPFCCFFALFKIWFGFGCLEICLSWIMAARQLPLENWNNHSKQSSSTKTTTTTMPRSNREAEKKMGQMKIIILLC